MRDIRDVIDKLLQAIPEDEIQLRYDLESISHDAGITAPEIMYMMWEQLGEKLAGITYSIHPLKDWQTKVIRIFSAKEVTDE